MVSMDRPEMPSSTDLDTGERGGAPPSKHPDEGSTGIHPEILAARERLQKARARMLEAAVAFCDGLISSGQLRAVREMLRENETRVADLEGEAPPPFVEKSDTGPIAPSPSVPVSQVPSPPPPAEAPQPEPAEEQTPPRTLAQAGWVDTELEALLTNLDEKIARLEDDFQQGRVNASQYRAIRRHYLEQHEVALRLHQANPASDRWRIVLEEGKTNFLMQLNEAECRCIAFYDLESQGEILLQGELPAAAKDAMRFLGTFGPRPTESTTGRMFATQTDQGDSLLLIPGRMTAALVVFSDEPPGWQVRALREVLRNFEAANQAALQRRALNALIFPNLDRFFRN